MDTKELWFKFYDVYIGQQSSHDGGTSLYESVTYGEHISMFSSFLCLRQKDQADERWDLVNSRTWEELIKIDSRYELMRILFV